MSPWSMWSSTPVTVTVWGTFQSVGVKVRLAVERLPSARSLEERPMVTLAVGGESRVIVKAAVPPSWVVTSPEVGVMLTPGAWITNVRTKSPPGVPSPLPSRSTPSKSWRLRVESLKIVNRYPPAGNPPGGGVKVSVTSYEPLA